MFRTLPEAAVLYPADAVSTEQLVESAVKYPGIAYIRTTRGKTPILYGPEETFPVGGCKVVRQSEQDRVTVVAAGITVHEALAAADELNKEAVGVRVVDLYSIKPLDRDTLERCAAQTGTVMTVEDHYAEGGLGEAVAAALPEVAVHILAVHKKPRSGTPEELLEDQGISRTGIARKIRTVLA